MMRRVHMAGAAWYLLVGLASAGSIHAAAATTTTALDVAYDKSCAAACSETFAMLKFADAADGAYYTMQECTSHLLQQSLYLCWDLYCSADARLAGARRANKTCREDYNEVMLPHSSVESFTEEEINALPRFNATNPGRGSRVTVMMLPSEDYHLTWAKTIDAEDYISFYHKYYGWAMGVFWACVVALGITHRALEYSDARSLRPSLMGQSKTNLWLKRHLLTPATFGQRSMQDFAGWGTVPPRVQTLTLVLFVLINVVSVVHGYRVFRGHVYYPTIDMQLLRHVSDRTGIVSFANFPLIWLFGMRNNLVIWLTGWEFKTYNNFHRWVARVATVQAIIHSVGYSVLIFKRGGWGNFWSMFGKTYWWTGEVATVVMSFLVLLSAFWFRRRHYEFFLVSHIVLSVVVVIAMLGHVAIYYGEYDAPATVAIAIWLLDRIVRIGRILAFNRSFWKKNARVTYNKETHMIRAIVSASSSLYRVNPGTFYYIMVLNKWRFWESHPFTVAMVPSQGRHRDSQEGDAPLLPRTGQTDEFVECRKEMAFLIRPYDSFTARLKAYAESAWPAEARLCVAIDGPYGKTLPLHRFNKVLFIVGGSGIAVPLSYLGMIISMSTGLGAVYIHWAVKQPALADDVMDNELAGISGSDTIHLNVYVTGDACGDAPNDAARRLGTWTSGRMNIRKVINDAVAEDGYSLAIVSSGPGRMADDCRRYAAAKMANSSCQIEYFEESFQW